MVLFRRCARNLSLALFLAVFQLGSYAEAETQTSWSGVYLGGFFGGAFGKYETNLDLGTSTSPYISTTNASSVHESGTATLRPSTFILGIKAGGDWAWEKSVVGLILDYGSLQQESNLQTTLKAYPDGSGSYSLSVTPKTEWLFTLRGRAGIKLEPSWPALLYVTGGMAMTKVHLSTSFSDNTASDGIGSSSISASQIGWAGGAGLELMLSSSLSITTEYLYVHVPKVEVSGSMKNNASGFGVAAGSLTTPYSTSVEFGTSLMRIGVNYRFSNS